MTQRFAAALLLLVLGLASWGAAVDQASPAQDEVTSTDGTGFPL